MTAAGPCWCYKCGNKRNSLHKVGTSAEDCGCDKYKDTENHFEFPAQLPWFKPEISDMDAKIEDTKFFKHMMEFGKKETGKFNLQLYRILAYSFPYYLPIEFHKMDSRAYMSHMDVSLKAASNFVVTNYINGSMYYLGIVNSCGDKDGRKLMMKNCLLNYLKRVGKNANLHFSEPSMSATDFLLEPWIIIQLPFQQGLVHQWMVAALAEYLEFQNQMAEFVHLRFRKEYREVVERLFEIGWKVLAAITCCLKELRDISYCNVTPKSGSSVFELRIEKMFFDPHGIIKNLPALEFMMSTRCKNMISALKRMAWAVPCKWETRLNSRYHTAMETLDCINFMYSVKFWKEGKLSDILGTSVEFDNTKENLLSEMPLEEHIDTEVSRDEIISFIEEKIIKPGRVSGLSTEEVLKSFSNEDYNNFVRFFKQLRFNKESAKGIRLEDSGVMMNLINLQCQLQASTFRAAMCDLIINANRHKDVLYHPVNNEGPDFTLARIEKAISQVEKNKKWSAEDIINQVKKQCPKPETLELPDVATMGVEKVASIFEARLKNTVFKMLESQFGMIKRKEARKFYPELLLIQYLLPRFVGIMLYMDKESKSLGKTGENEELKRYVYFLHNLINCYEVPNCYKMVPRAAIPGSFHGVLLQQSEFRAANMKIAYIRDTLLGIFPNRNSIAHKMYCCCVEVLNECNLFPCTMKIVFIPTFVWNVDLYQFLTKVSNSLQLTMEYIGRKVNKEHLMALNYWTIEQIGGISLNMGGKGASTEDYIYQLQRIYGIKSFTAADNFLAVRNALGSRMEEEANTVKIEQLSGLLIYLALKNLCGRETYLANSCTTLVPFDNLETIFYAFVQGDRWRVKQILSLWLTYRDKKDDLSTVTLKFAKAHPALYGPVLKDLRDGWKWEKGEISFFPIMHCRWCGNVDCSAFRICKECQDSEDYPDINLFCSEKCEKEALMDIHLEEHARFVIEKCKF